MVPGQRRLNARASSHRAASAAPARAMRARDVARTERSASTKSMPQPRCGPCCSVAPTGRIAAPPRASEIVRAVSVPGAARLQATAPCGRRWRSFDLVPDVGRGRADEVGLNVVTGSSIAPPLGGWISASSRARVGAELRAEHLACAARARHRHLDQFGDLAGMRRRARGCGRRGGSPRRDRG